LIDVNKFVLFDRFPHAKLTADERLRLLRVLSEIWWRLWYEEQDLKT
jgi:hypothetical protein